MMVSDRNLLFQGLIFRFHVKLWGGRFFWTSSSTKMVATNFGKGNEQMIFLDLDQFLWLFLLAVMFHFFPLAPMDCSKILASNPR